MTADVPLTAEAAALRARQRIDELDDEAVFIATVSAAEMMAAAARIDARPPELVPLRGLVFAVKDNIDVEGLPTTAACPSFAFAPSVSAFVVDRLIEAGALLVGKTNMDQFATGLVGTRSPFGVPVNPLDGSLVPGGSSSGSAVAVARSIVDFSLGTDTAGSGRVPAAMCGIVGTKPTVGRLSTSGVVPAVRSFDVVSIFSRDVRTSQRVLAAADGFDADDAFARVAPLDHTPVAPLGAARVGVLDRSELGSMGCTDAVIASYGAALERLAALGAEVTVIDPSPFFEIGDLLYGGPWLAERTAVVGEALASAPDADPVVRDIVANGSTFSAIDAHQASYRRMALLRDAQAHFDSIDVLMTPTIPATVTLDQIAADPVSPNTAMGRFTTFVNMADLSAVTIPQGDRSGESVTLVGPAWHDQRLLGFAAEMLGEDSPPSRPIDGAVSLVVAGAHLRGQALEHQLLDLGAVWRATTTTAPTYRLYALESVPPKPAMIRDGDGDAIEVDVWELSDSALGRFLRMIPAPLALGQVELADGSMHVGFVAEPRAVDGATEITSFGGWRAYRSA